MQLTVIGVNHQTAPISIRELVSFNLDKIPKALQSIIENNNIDEVLILSTCNRTEIYFYSIVNDNNYEPVISWLAKYNNLNLENLMPYLYIYENKEAVLHTFRVACGLDSMVIGEPQILGQLKQAIKIAQNENTIKSFLNMLFQRTLSIAKEVRTISKIGEKSISMATAAIKMAEKIFPDLTDLNALFIGAGEMIELVATHFNSKKLKIITVANRTLNRANELIKSLNINNANSILLADIPSVIQQYDIIVSSTASQLPILGKGIIENSIQKRKNKPIFILDLAVPRDIESQVNQLNNVYLYTIDDIISIVNYGYEERKKSADIAESLIQNHVTEYIKWQESRKIIPLIVNLRNIGEKKREIVLNNSLKLLSKGIDPKEVLKIMSIQLTNKLLHPPTKALHKFKNNDKELIKIIAEIYNLENKKDFL